MTKREQRVIHAFLNCIRHGEYSEDYAITLIEDNARYGWVSEAAKEAFYEALDELHLAEEPEKTESASQTTEENLADKTMAPEE